MIKKKYMTRSTLPVIKSKNKGNFFNNLRKLLKNP